MDKKVLTFIINGPAQSGKDTFIQLVRDILTDKSPVYSFSAVDEVKAELKQNEGWDGITKDEYWRKRMYDLKMEHVADNDRPTRYLISQIEKIDNGIVFLHIREIAEVKKFLERMPQTRTIHIHRDGVEKFTNNADAGTNDFKYDYYIENNGTLEDLSQKAREFVDGLFFISGTRTRT